MAYFGHVGDAFVDDITSCGDWLGGVGVTAALSLYRYTQGKGFAISCAVAGLASVFSLFLTWVSGLPYLFDALGLSVHLSQSVVVMLAGGVAIAYEEMGRRLDIRRMIERRGLDIAIGAGLAYLGYAAGHMIANDLICPASSKS
jgi:hypothetical protein